jgi:hypothetical protein
MLSSFETVAHNDNEMSTTVTMTTYVPCSKNASGFAAYVQQMERYNSDGSFKCDPWWSLALPAAVTAEHIDSKFPYGLTHIETEEIYVAIMKERKEFYYDEYDGDMENYLYNGMLLNASAAKLVTLKQAQKEVSLHLGAVFIHDLLTTIKCYIV